MEQEIVRKGPKRLIMNISETIHQEIKTRSALRHISMRKWVTRAIIEKIKKEKEFE